MENTIVKLSLNLALWQYTLHVYEGSQKTEHTFDVPLQCERDALCNGEAVMLVMTEDKEIELPPDIFQLMEDEISKDPLIAQARFTILQGEYYEKDFNS
jgi:hypothetical protein